MQTGYSPFPHYSPTHSLDFWPEHHYYLHYYDRPRIYTYYRNHYNSVGNSNIDGNFNGDSNANNFNNNQNMQTNQNDQLESTQPFIYITSNRITNDNADSTEIIFINQFLMIGVENMLLMAEFQDEQDVLIIMEQNEENNFHDEENTFVDKTQRRFDLYPILESYDETTDEQRTIPNYSYHRNSEIKNPIIKSSTAPYDAQQSEDCSEFLLPDDPTPQQLSNALQNLNRIAECSISKLAQTYADSTETAPLNQI